MLYKGSIYLKVGEVGEVDGMKIRAVKDEHEPHMSCKYCCFGGDSLIGLCTNMACQKGIREDGIGVVFEFAE